ncbi:hypothetical protein AvCA_02100 [Azotobacter vinelandii CA]|uniref:Uncharacterized protein n=3 Tax=Azotobacter group TaxID=351 RepID=C1DH64_AZOVD|nr:hypothetical protein Avin_02100 [Azotobacter vinelandii DJ]AGK15668.1 hypothetical protein AvCA_02100 [Azotobacter vinelandii CA]AGK19145.1 hypothetical protein AvCA6_02100 [Azotobacter vinelandii CA6]GLK58659.1 hypothetical protein GCM10017624_08160 [Azotobacter vinelandii]SFX08747.1 hypothetical protein SAMN04244547_00335 [Azotobacter vinelandii]
MGTRFAVRQENGRTRVVVEAHVVEVRPRLAQARAVRVEAGRGLSFDVLASGPLLPAPADAGALTLDDGEAVLDILEAPLPVRDEVGKASGLIPRPSRKILSSG